MFPGAKGISAEPPPRVALLISAIRPCEITYTDFFERQAPAREVRGCEEVGRPTPPSERPDGE